MHQIVPLCLPFWTHELRSRTKHTDIIYLREEWGGGGATSRMQSRAQVAIPSFFMLIFHSQRDKVIAINLLFAFTWSYNKQISHDRSSGAKAFEPSAID